MSKYPESILNQSIESLGMSSEFTGITEILGIQTLADVLKYHTRDLQKLPGFSIHLIHEYIHFLEARNLGHYVDESDVKRP